MTNIKMKPIKRWAVMDKKGRLYIDCYGDLNLSTKKPVKRSLLEGEYPVQIEIREFPAGGKCKVVRSLCVTHRKFSEDCRKSGGANLT